MRQIRAEIQKLKTGNLGVPNKRGDDRPDYFHTAIVTAYNREELLSLVFSMGYEVDDIAPPGVGIRMVAINLISKARGDNEVAKLARLLDEEKPGIDWELLSK